MPNRYEREIEEILRNLEQTEPKPGRGQKLGERLRRRPGPRVRRQSSFSFNLSTTEWLLTIAVSAALLAGGYAFTLKSAGPGGIFTPIVASVSLICLFVVAFSHYLLRARSPRPVRFGNATVTPLRRNPLSNLQTRWHLFMLKLRYRRNNER